MMMMAHCPTIGALVAVPLEGLGIEITMYKRNVESQRPHSYFSHSVQRLQVILEIVASMMRLATLHWFANAFIMFPINSVSLCY